MFLACNLRGWGSIQKWGCIEADIVLICFDMQKWGKIITYIPVGFRITSIAFSLFDEFAFVELEPFSFLENRTQSRWLLSCLIEVLWSGSAEPCDDAL